MNERKILILAIFIIFLSFICQESNLTGHSIYNTGESFESNGRTITINKISQSNVVIDVDGIKNIISLGEHKIINGVDIKVLNIFYTEEIEARNVDLSINVLDAGTCGDGECKAGETSGSCCKDCGCPTDYVCENSECKSSIPIECRKHEDCDDGNPNTIDLCVDLAPKTCKHYIEPVEDTESETQESKSEEITEKTNIPEDSLKSQGLFSKLFSFFRNLF